MKGRDSEKQIKMQRETFLKQTSGISNCGKMLCALVVVALHIAAFSNEYGLRYEKYWF